MEGEWLRHSWVLRLLILLQLVNEVSLKSFEVRHRLHLVQGFAELDFLEFVFCHVFRFTREKPLFFFLFFEVDEGLHSGEEF